MSSGYRVVGFEKLAVADTALGLASIPTGARSFIGTVETATIRYRGDGSDSATATGELFLVGDKIVLSESEIANASFVRATGSSGTIQGHYYNIEAGQISATRA
jgi:hypothetical protein